MRLALDLAARGIRAGYMPIGAVLVARGEVVAEAFWRGRDAGGLLGHPESRVLTAADQFMDFQARREATLYTTLEPCLMCMGTAMSFFLGRVVYALGSVAPTRGSRPD
jgi:tRNA(adenine34) deaminase